MAVVLRLTRTGRRNRPCYRICVFDGRTRRDGRSIEEIGYYDPVAPGEEIRFRLNEERARHWLAVGARPSETVAALLKRCNIPVPESNRSQRRRKARKRSGA